MSYSFWTGNKAQRQQVKWTRQTHKKCWVKHRNTTPTTSYIHTALNIKTFEVTGFMWFRAVKWRSHHIYIYTWHVAYFTRELKRAHHFVKPLGKFKLSSVDSHNHNLSQNVCSVCECLADFGPDARRIEHIVDIRTTESHVFGISDTGR